MSQKFDKSFIRKVEKAIEVQISDHLDKIALRASARLIEATPVDTGQASASWRLALNEKDTSKPKTQGKRYYRRRLAKGNKKARRIGDTYYLVNVARHIIFLNEGSSERAPTNFIDAELRAAIKDVEGSR